MRKKAMTYEEDYIAHIKEITEKCEAAGLDVSAIVDRGVNEQDAHHDFGTDQYWDTMIYAASIMAAFACEELGANINDIMGRNIY
jgi:hypothetical protein